MRLDLSREVVIRPAGLDDALAPLVREAGFRVLQDGQVAIASLDQLPPTPPAAAVALSSGNWPSASRPPARDNRYDEVAGASRQPWVDANGYWIQYLNALYPHRPPVLAYLPDEKAGLKPDRMVPYDSLELALIEAWVFGGNYMLALEARFRQALLKHDPKATAAWSSLAATARWLRQHLPLYRQSVVPIVTALVEPGENTAEMANLMYRQNVSPRLAPAAAPPAPDPRATLALVAVSLASPAPAARARILAHAAAGAIVVVDAPGAAAWWRHPGLKLLRSEDDRDFYTLGRGQLVAYREPISDVSEFAFDVIDLITHKRRALRLWGAHASIGLLTLAPPPDRATLHVINYGSPTKFETQARVQGVFAGATLLRPDAPPSPLATARRGSTTEVQIPPFCRLASVVFR
jgi:hypothetical protein